MAQNVLDLSPDDNAKVLTLEDFKKRVRAADCLDEMFEVATILQDRGDDLRKNQIDALRLRFDIQKTLLNKLVPDLKAIDHTSGELASKVSFVMNFDTPTSIEAKLV